MDETSNTQAETATIDRKPMRMVWVGFATSFAGAVSYFLYFTRFPSLRDFPIVNLPIVGLGVMLAIAGCRTVFSQSARLAAKVAAGVGLTLSVGIASLFCFYVFLFSYQLPGASAAPTVQSAAPDFSLQAPNGEQVRLSDYRGKKVILVFYRGFW